MAIYRLNLKKGATVTKKSPSTSGQSKAHYDYIVREGNYKENDPEKSDLVKIENPELDSKKFPLGYDPNPNFTKLGYSQEEYWKKSNDKFYVGNSYTPYKEFKLTLPSELSNEENVALAQEYCRERFGDKYLYTMIVHAPDFDNNSEKSEKGEKQTHAHIMFSQKIIDYDNLMPMEQFLKSYNYRDKDRPKELRTGGAAIDREMNSYGGRVINGEYKKGFVQTSRELWEKVLNEKLVEKGIEPVSCKTLKQQRLEALANGDYEKAELLDRPPINKDFRLYQQKEDTLSVADKVILEQHKINIETKKRKIAEYSKKYNKEVKPIELINDIIFQYPAKKEKAQALKPTADKIVAQVLNNVSDGRYFQWRNELKKLQQKEKQQKLDLTLEKNKVIKALENLKSTHINSDYFKSKVGEFNTNYDKKVNKALEKINSEELKLNEILEKLTNTKAKDVVKSVVREDTHNPAKDVPAQENVVENLLELLEDWEIEEDIFNLIIEKLADDIKTVLAKDRQTVINNILHNVADIVQEKFIEKFKGTKHESKIADYVSNVCYNKDFTVSIVLGRVEELAK